MKMTVRRFTLALSCLFMLQGSPLQCRAQEPKARATDDPRSLDLLVATLDKVDDPAVHAAILKGMIRGLEGSRNVSPPVLWQTLSEKLARSSSTAVRQQALKLSQQFGDVQAIQNAIALIRDKAADVDRRKSALSLLLSQQNREASGLLESLMDEPAMRMDAIRGYAAVANTRAPAVLLDRYSGMNVIQKRAAIETLSSRSIYAEDLLKAITSDRVSKKEIPAQVARSLKDLLGNRFTEIYGDVKAVAKDRVQAIAKYKKICTPNAVARASASRGRAVYQRTCAACHVMYGDGGAVGPDLTGSNRANLDYILLNSVAPSYDVPEAYRTVSVLTVDGRVINGVLAEEDTSRIVLKTPEQPRLVIAKEDIEQRKVSPMSMMPDGQLDQMNKQQVLDLIKYLKTTKQVEMPK